MARTVEDPGLGAVLVACFEGLAADRFVREAVAGLPHCELISARRAVLARIRETKAQLLILPSVDASGISTAELARRCTSRVAGLAVIALVTKGVESDGHGLSTWRGVNAEFVSPRTTGELRSLVERARRPAGGSGTARS
ncbi:MAG TPA: hypothetical protein VMH39_00525 [Gemmatimonadaceae bacterium]|nr:hypothetical protein [Gemmatimonadaceae bacterium]